MPNVQELRGRPRRMGLREDPDPASERLRAAREPTGPRDALTGAQQITLHLLAKGLSNGEIAAISRVNEKTIRQRVKDIYDIFGVSRHYSVQRVIVARWWWERGIHAAPEKIRNL